MGCSGKRIALGKAGEEYAERLLLKKGYRIQEKNYRCRFGEIDIIALDKKTLVFVEVRTRSSMQYGTAGESITRTKKERLKKLALYYTLTKKITDTNCRFDVVSIHSSGSGFKADLFRNAFF